LLELNQQEVERAHVLVAMIATAAWLAVYLR